MIDDDPVGGRLVSLAAGVTPELADEPRSFVEAAAAAGWPACGVWFAPDSWSDATTSQVRRVLADNEMVALDIEVVRLGQHDPRPLVAAGSEIGARHVLAVSFLPDRGETIARFAELCELAGEAGLRACLEFMPFSSVRDLRDAVAVATASDHRAAAVLVDTLHLARAGGTPGDVLGVDRRLLPYAQWCDGAATIADGTTAGLVADALDGRSCPGEGELPVDEFLAAIGADTPVSLEIRSAVLRARFPDPIARASAVRASLERRRDPRPG